MNRLSRVGWLAVLTAGLINTAGCTGRATIEVGHPSTGRPTAGEHQVDDSRSDESALGAAPATAANEDEPPAQSGSELATEPIWDLIEKSLRDYSRTKNTKKGE
jgi:hypothetical protein